MLQEFGAKLGKFLNVPAAGRISQYARPVFPKSSGVNEHTNGLVREFFPKSQDLREVDPGEVRGVQDMLNTRPRRVLSYRTPAEVFCEALEAVGGRSSAFALDLCSCRE